MFCSTLEEQLSFTAFSTELPALPQSFLDTLSNVDVFFKEYLTGSSLVCHKRP
jgi:hypothetical protein